MADDPVGVDLTDLDTFANGFPHGVIRLHPEVAPVWQPASEALDRMYE